MIHPPGKDAAGELVEVAVQLGDDRVVGAGAGGRRGVDGDVDRDVEVPFAADS